ncbi:PfkB family carbohydrate kinase (plasmid) [Rhizobium sp. RCAM05350]|nr:PfkB family carbohydrate kinase [Rhizobium sp. RCAM05350]
MPGDTYNTAGHLARLLKGSDWTVEYVTLLGKDCLSNQIVSHMQNEGVSTRLVGRHPDRLPGIYAVERGEKGERSFLYWRANSAARRLFSDGLPGLGAGLG